MDCMHSWCYCVTCRSGVCKDFLPVLHFVAEHGNVTMFEWQSGKRPKRVEATEVDFDASDDEDDVDIKDADNGEVSCISFIIISSSTTELIEEGPLPCITKQ